MAGLNSLGLSGSDSVNRVDGGTGRIGQRTIELGASVIAVSSIGTIRVVDGKRGHLLTVVGALIALVGLGSFGVSKFFASIVLLIGIGLAAWNLLRAVEQYLSIGTCDGRITTIVSTDRAFLDSVRTFIRDKIESGSLSSAVVNISNSKLEGTIAIGENAKAIN
jgi:Family of unknown function (DUF6232)